MDEPEAALSPRRQLEFLALLHDFCKQGSQFLIATHSPIIMAYPDALDLCVGPGGHTARALCGNGPLPGDARVSEQPAAVAGCPDGRRGSGLSGLKRFGLFTCAHKASEQTTMADPTSETSWGLRRQLEIYQAGLAGKTPAHPVSVDELELEAKSVLKTEAFDYVAGGAGSEDTMRANREAFRRWRIVPRFLRDVSRRDLGVEVLGVKLRAPVMLAPIGVLSIVHKDAELAVARAARALDVPMILSTASSHTMEAVAGALGDDASLVSALLATRR